MGMYASKACRVGTPSKVFQFACTFLRHVCFIGDNLFQFFELARAARDIFADSLASSLGPGLVRSSFLQWGQMPQQQADWAYPAKHFDSPHLEHFLSETTT
jgi:hypothetical protein